MRALAVNLARLLAAGAVVGIAGIAVIYGAWRFFQPYAQERETRAEVARLQRRVNAFEAEHRRLQHQAHLLATPEGIKIEARRLGLLKPGERSLRFMTRPGPREQPAQTRSAPLGLWQRLSNWRAMVFPGRPTPPGVDRKAQPPPRGRDPTARAQPARPHPEPAPDD
jgi:cell division protein FtsB